MVKSNKRRCGLAISEEKLAESLETTNKVYCVRRANNSRIMVKI